MVKNGLAVENSIYTKTVINNVGQFIGDPTGVIQNSYDKANSANVLAQAAFDKANSLILTANTNFAVTGIDYFPIGDYGYYIQMSTDSYFPTESKVVEYDMEFDPIIPHNFYFKKDLGYL